MEKPDTNSTIGSSGNETTSENSSKKKNIKKSTKINQISPKLKLKQPPIIQVNPITIKNCPRKFVFDHTVEISKNLEREHQYSYSCYTGKKWIRKIIYWASRILISILAIMVPPIILMITANKDKTDNFTTFWLIVISLFGGLIEVILLIMDSLTQTLFSKKNIRYHKAAAREAIALKLQILSAFEKIFPTEKNSVTEDEIKNMIVELDLVQCCQEAKFKLRTSKPPHSSDLEATNRIANRMIDENYV